MGPPSDSGEMRDAGRPGAIARRSGVVPGCPGAVGPGHAGPDRGRDADAEAGAAGTGGAVPDRPALGAHRVRAPGRGWGAPPHPAWLRGPGVSHLSDQRRGRQRDRSLPESDPGEPDPTGMLPNIDLRNRHNDGPLEPSPVGAFTVWKTYERWQYSASSGMGISTVKEMP